MSLFDWVIILTVSPLSLLMFLAGCGLLYLTLVTEPAPITVDEEE